MLINFWLARLSSSSYKVVAQTVSIIYNVSGIYISCYQLVKLDVDYCVHVPGIWFWPAMEY